MRALLHGIAATALLFAAGCATRMHLPDAFLELKGNGYRAVTADDARVWVRTFDAPGEGNAEFWSKTLEEELARNRGYKVVKQGNCRDADGHDGRWLECTARRQSLRVRGRRPRNGVPAARRSGARRAVDAVAVNG